MADTLDALEADAFVQHRTLVPSDREVVAGTVPAGWEPPEHEQGPRRTRASRREAYLNRFRALDPRGIADGKAQLLPLAVLSLLVTVGELDDTAIVILRPFIQLDLDIDFQTMGTITAVLGATAALLGPAVGYLADRHRRVRFLQFGSILQNGAAVATALAPTAGAFAATRVVGGVGPALTVPVQIPLLTDYFPIEKRPRALGFQAMLRQVFNSVQALLLFLAFFVLSVPWRVILAVFAGIGLLTALATLFMREPARGGVDRRSAGLPEDAPEPRPATFAEAWRAARSISTLRRLWYAQPFFFAAVNGLQLFLFFALQEKLAADPPGLLQSEALRLALPAVLQIGSIVLVTALLPKAVERFAVDLKQSPGRLITFLGTSFVLFAASSVVVLVTPAWALPLALVGSVVVGTIAGLGLVAQQLLLAVIVPARIRAQGVQTLGPWQCLGYAALPTIGAFGDRYGATTAVLFLVPFLLVGAAILLTGSPAVQRDIRSALFAGSAELESRRAAAEGRAKLLVCRGLDVSYDGAQVLFGLDLDVHEGELVALVGTNGAGKSTLLQAICGLHEANGGAVFLDGEDVTHRPTHMGAAQGVVFLPGGRAVFPSLTVAENLRAATWLVKEEDAALIARREELLDLFPVLRQRADELAGNLSGGEQQMLGVTQAFLMQPRLLMIDELSLGLAPAVVEQLLGVVRRINEQGATVLLVEQSVNVALTVADRAVFMEKGRVRFDGPTEQLLRRADLVRAVFLGGSAGSFRGLGLSRHADSLGEEALSVDGLSVAYGGVSALERVDLRVEAGEIVGVIGANGAGKTTLFDAISGFTAPTAGSIRIATTDATDASPDARARLGLARSFQAARLFPSMTVTQCVATALEQRLETRSALLAAAWAPRVRRSERRVARRVGYLIELVGLDACADKFVNELSTGTRRMVDLACILAAEPRIVLLDEPSSGLAQGEIEMLGPTLQRLARESRCGVLVIEHDIPLVSEVSDRMYALERGRVIAEGEPDDVLHDARVLRSYLAASSSVIARSGAPYAEALDALGIDTSLPTADDGDHDNDNDSDNDRSHHG